MQPILGFPGRILRRIRRRGGVVRTHTFSPVPKWASIPDPDRQRIRKRLNRFSGEYHNRYRESGLLRLPLRHEIRNGTQIFLEDCALPGKAVPAADVHRMEPAQIDTVFRTLLMQLRQLESIGFVHGAISPDTVRVCPAPKVYSAAVTDITSGRFTDEPVQEENLVSSGCMTPEACRAIRYPYADQTGQETDVFSAGCLYYLWLTGRELRVGDSPVTPAEAAWLDIPVPLEGVYGFRASVIRWMLAPAQEDRPTAAMVLEALAEAEKRNLPAEMLPAEMALPGLTVSADGITPDAPAWRRFAWDPQGNRYIAEILHRMWPCGTGAGNDLFVRQQAFLARETRRLDDLSVRSRAWHGAHPGIDVCWRVDASPFPLTLTPIAGEVCIPLGRLREAEPSVFMLDARMTEILMMARVLHEDDCILGLLSENSFYVSMTPAGPQAHYAGAASAISLSAVPCAADLTPDSNSLRIMSPEMSAFIASRSGTEAEAYQLNLGPASDVFALGMLYHLLLTGRYPQVDLSTQFDENRPYGTFSNAVCHASWPEEAIVPDHALDRKHSALIRQMIAMNPRDRVSDCGQIANIIMGFYTE